MSARGWLAILVLALLAGGGSLAWLRLEGEPPEVDAPESLLVGAAGASVALGVHDAGTGLRSIAVALRHGTEEQSLHAESFPGSLWSGAVRRSPLELELPLDPKALPPKLAEATLVVSARDWSWRGGLGGNLRQLEIPVTIDRRPPRVAVMTGLSYVRRGGSGVVVYSLSEQTRRDGVAVGESFFPGFPMGERRVAFYAVPTDAPREPALRVVAEDAAGNQTRARWPVVVNERDLPHSRIDLPQSFLDEVVPELATAEGIESGDPQEAFRIINTEVRQRDEARIRELLADSSPQRLWEGPFLQLANSQVTSRFADQRSYWVAGQRNSEAVHYGYDLASTQAAPVTAAAAGRVVYADELGIYGNCVLIDHGLGVASLYGHLSRVDVNAGDSVERGQSLGLTGSTGLAGGDHLHFAILVGGSYVDPLEWWDAKWVGTNVEARLLAARP